MPATALDTAGTLFQNLPQDIICLIFENLKSVDIVCLALASKQLREVTLILERAQSMSDIIAYKPSTAKNHSPSDIQSHYRLRELLWRLQDWVPAAHILCSNDQDKLVRGGEDGGMCYRCTETVRRVRYNSIKDLREKRKKKLQLQWYETQWLERQSGDGCDLLPR